jgi:divalent metal cation (Fe/Co/Zn/Cd) transporter
MFREAAALPGVTSSPVDDRPVTRTRHVRLAVIVCGASVVWAALVGLTSLAVGAATGSLALLAFGLSSAIDGSASAVLVWRFRRERFPSAPSSHDTQRVEGMATRAVAVAMLLSAAYVLVQAGRSLIAQAHPEQSDTGVVLLTGSLFVLPPLGIVKVRLAGRLRSPALRGDGILSIVGAALAATALIGLAANAWLGWWWTDSTAASLIALFLVREGRHTLRTFVRP